MAMSAAKSSEFRPDSLEIRLFELHNGPPVSVEAEKGSDRK